MEVLKERIKQFLAIDVGNGYGTGNGNGNGTGHGNGSGTGYGYGDGDGKGYGDGDGEGYGYGDGKGYGDGDGEGYGYGDGNGDGYGTGKGIAEIDGMEVHMVDGTPTIITAVRGNIAQGYILRRNVILKPCYIAKVGNFFAHGRTARKAYEDALEKAMENEPIEQRIARVKEQYPTLDTLVSHKELYRLHHILTGSCEMGRKEFAASHGLDPDKGEMTMQDFINLTSSAYGGEVIKQLKEVYQK